MQCDCCSRFTDRLHHGEMYGCEYAACDQCCNYDAAAYDEPMGRYLDEEVDPEDIAYAFREPHGRDTP
jgi:hypothetical protein